MRNTLEPEARVYALVKDGSGQTLQYRPERCPFETASDEWCNLDVDLRLPSAHWGGANNGLIQGNITELSLLVQALDGVRGRVPIEGTVQFDSVTLSNAPTTISFARGDAGAKWRELSLVDTSAKLGVAVHFSGSRRDKQDRLQKAKEAGFGFVRTDLYWDQIERVRRNYDFAAADQLVADARALGLKVLFILDYGNPLYKSGVLMSSEGERNAFAAYAAAAAARFKGQGVKFEIWNEQNSGANCPEAGFWPHRPHAQHYAQLVSATMRAIRPVDPGALVTLGGLTPSYTSPCELNEPTQFSFQYIRDLADAGGLNDVNALGYHPYYDIAERWGAELQMLRRLLREKGQPNLPVWETEWGVSSACPDGERPCTQGHTAIKRDRQAVRLARRLLVGLAMGLPINVWYDLADDGVDPNNREHHFGLYDHQLLAKPALAAMKTLAAVSQERLSGLVPDLPGGVHAVRFHKGAETIYAIWTERGNIQLTSDLNGLVNAVDVQGKNLPFSGRWTLRETDGPIYLTYR